MRKYNIPNYIRYKNDLKSQKPKGESWNYFNREDLIKMHMPLVENVARKFSTGDQASGILTIMDMIQIGHEALIKAVDRVDWTHLEDKKNIDETLKSFLSKRIKGAIRRKIDTHRGNMRIPEHQLNKIRKNGEKDKKMVEMFFNSVFLSIDAHSSQGGQSFAEMIEDPVRDYNADILDVYLIGLMNKHLTEKQFDVLKYSYGIRCEKLPAKEIAARIGIQGSSAYVRVSQIKREAIEKLMDNVDATQVADCL